MTNIELSSYGSISSEERNDDNDNKAEQGAIATVSPALTTSPPSSSVGHLGDGGRRNDDHYVRKLLAQVAIPSFICISVGILYLASSLRTGNSSSVGRDGRTSIFPWTSPWRVGQDRIHVAGIDAADALGYLQSLADAALAARQSPPRPPGRHQHRGKKRGQERGGATPPPPPPTLGNKPQNATEQPLLPPRGCESTVMIVRHCEKDVLEENCDYVGFERAEYLKHLFGANLATGQAGAVAGAVAGAAVAGGGEAAGYEPRWPAPSHLFALSAQRHSRHHKNYREIQTLQPLADKFSLPIDSNYSVSRTGDLAHLVFDRLHAGETCGKLTVVCWKHSEIPSLAQSLGCGPLQGCPMDYPAAEFDAVWQIKFVYDGTSHGGLPRDPIPVQQRATVAKARKRQAPTWKVFGSVQHQGFDPLEFSTRVGDYPDGGVETGGRWIQSSFRVKEVES